MQSKKILICYSRAGGGHEAMAHIIANGLESHNVQLLDIGNSNQLLSDVLSHGYVWLTEKAPFIWYILSIIWKTRIGMYLTRVLTKWNIIKKLSESIDDFKPDLVISTYYFISTIARDIQPYLQTCTVVSDIFAVQSIWFYDTAEQYIVMSKQSKVLALQSGVPEKNIFACNPVYHEKYDAHVTTLQINECISILNIPYPKYPALLIVGGGSSIPRGYKLIKELITLKNPCELYIVCGRNKTLKKKLEILKTTLQPDQVHRIHIIGFTHHIRELITLCDVVISKAGPGIILESLSLKKPIFLYHYIWEQEKPNMEFIVTNGFGIYESNLKKLTQIIDNVVKETAFLEKYRTNLSNYSIHNGQPEMINYIKSQLSK